MSSLEVARFHWADYLIFGTVLGLSASVGVYYAITERKKESTESFLMGNRRLHSFPVALSIYASFVSAISVIGQPSDFYSYGSQFYAIRFAYFLAIPITAHILIPVFHGLKVKSIYEYFEIRYNYIARIAASTTFMIQMQCYMAVVLYTPSLAFSQVSGIPLWACIVGVGAVCTFYTTLGGMKAVVWTDAIQMAICAAGLLAVLIQGTIQLGGFDAVWNRAMNGSRIQNLDFNLDPRVRYSFWNTIIGGTFQLLTTFGANQAMIQRYMSVEKVRDAQISVYLNIPFTFIMGTMFVYCGLVAYAQYHDCDPLLAGKITRRDQMIPLMVLEILGHLPGIPGLFLASVFSAALSTVSSGLNSLSAVTLEDYIKPVVKYRRRNLTEKQATFMSKILTLFFGLLTIGLAFVPSVLGAQVLQIAISLLGMTGGPMLGMILLAILFPFSNAWGATIGLLCGLTCTMWIGIGAIFHPSPQPLLEFGTAGCTAYNATSNMTAMISTVIPMTTESLTTLAHTVEDKGFTVEDLYSLSFMWYSGLGTGVTLIFGIIISLLTGRTKGRNVDPTLVVPIFDKICCCFPESWRRPCRCGVPVKDNCLDLEEKYFSSTDSIAGNEIIMKEIEAKKTANI